MARGNIFSNPKKKENMLILRIKNYSYEKIAARYGVDHTTIIYHCKEAGITLPIDIRNKMYELIDDGIPIVDISGKLGISMEVIDLYTSIYGPSGKKVFSRRVIQTKQIDYSIVKLGKSIKIQKGRNKITVKPIWWSPVRLIKPVLLKIPRYVPKGRNEIVPIEPEPIQIITKIDKRGVEWIQDIRGRWICMGISEEAKRLENEKKKIKTLELKRLQMLTY